MNDRADPGTCVSCGHALEDDRTTFAVAKGKCVYVVANVPCRVCSRCGQLGFAQDVTERLDQYASGRAVSLSQRPPRAYVYDWDDQLVVVPRSKPTIGVKNTELKRASSSVLAYTHPRT